MENYLGEIRLFAGNYVPQDWNICDGSTFKISEYEALYSIIGTTYGGDGVTTFKIPDLRNRVVVGVGQLLGGSNYILAQQGGAATVTLTPSQIPAHNHTLNAVNKNATSEDPTGSMLACTIPPTSGGYDNVYLYTKMAPTGTLDSSSIQPLQGGGQPHNNMMPYVTLNYIIAMLGIYPTS